MSRVEKIPLLSSASTLRRHSSDTSDGYMLLSVSHNKDTLFIQKLNKLGNYCGIIVAISVTVIVLLLIIGVSYHADISELTSQREVKKASSSDIISATDKTNSQEIETPLGRLRGYIKKSRKGREYLAYYKVPYAKPPTGKLRFKDPQPVEGWSSIRDFDDVAPSCIQKSKHIQANITSGDEDCLYSNIYVPNSVGRTGDKLPVMVYIHGGGYTDGNGSRYGAQYFMDEDVVLITFQYRLGLLGFLNTGDREATGNMGFKDQVMMLKWTKAYIQCFNGNPDKVTIFGNSMGGFSTSYLMISPMANGLFHQAISQSGTVLSESTSNLDLQPELTKKAIAEACNCSMESSAELLDCLREVDARNLVLLKAPGIKYALTVEHGFDPEDLSDVFMPDKPYNLLKAGKLNKVPYIMGVVSTEWLGMSIAFLQNDELVSGINANFSHYAPGLLDMDLTEEECLAIKSFYFNDKRISNETERNLTNLLSDRIMVHGIKVTADFHSLVSDTYLYVLSKRPAKSYADKILANFPIADKKNTVSHADELQFQFPYYGYPEYPVSDKEYFPFSEFFVKLWANFAATGKPRIDGKVNDWNVINNSNVRSSVWYELNDLPGVTTALQERMGFWDQFSHKKMMYDL